MMVDSNLQRDKILPSEKAKAYKIKLDTLNHRGKRLSPLGISKASVNEISDSKSKNKRYTTEDYKNRYLESYIKTMKKILKYIIYEENT